MTTQKLSESIAAAYHGCDGLVLEVVRDLIQNSRKYGLPFVCSIPERSEEQLVLWAAKLLLKVTNAWPHIDDGNEPDFELIQGSRLHSDAAHLVSNALLNSQQLFCNWSGGKHLDLSLNKK